MAKSNSQRREEVRKYLADKRLVERDIGDIPPSDDPELVESLGESLRLFCETVLADWFTDPWSDDHLRIIDKIERCIRHGETFALAMPRASGKSSLIKAALIWAVLYGYRRYVVLIGADASAGAALLQSIKVQFETNRRMLSLYPEACIPAKLLGGNAQAASSQIHHGERTHILWKSSKCVLANIPGAKCAGAVIECFGILGRLRGASHSRPDGEVMRPDLFMIDDPQTDRSAETPSQINKRLSVTNGAVLGLAGPGKSISGFACVTVIRPDDMADQLLDRDKFPDWAGERCKLVYQFPSSRDAQKHWEQYAQIRAEGLRNSRGISEATDYYRENREVMDTGAKVGWDSRYNEEIGEISALQHAYNLKLKSPETFDAEYQNDPAPKHADADRMTAKQVESKTSGFAREVLPVDCDLVTAFVDVQQSVLYWMVCGWDSSSFSGQVLSYGTWPDQKKTYYKLSTIGRSLDKKYRGGLEARLRAGLHELLDFLIAKRFKTSDGDIQQRLQLVGIDAAWGPSTKVVQTVALEHPQSRGIMPTFGRGLKPNDRPMSDWRKKPGERKGGNWILRPTQGGGRHLIVDTNRMKTFTAERLKTVHGDPGSLTLYRPSVAGEHRMLSEHITAEAPSTLTVEGGPSGTVWKLSPQKPDNHFWDCSVGCAVMASVCGAKLKRSDILPARRIRRKQRPKVTLNF